MKKYGFKNYLKYRFDNRMAKGNSGMVKMLLTATLVVVVALSVAITLLTEAEERSFFGSLWDTMASTVNAWMPYSEDGNVGSIVLTALAAVTGLLFTSILIGIITTAIEEKVTGLREGNSVVLENGHVVVLGFTPGEYTLIEQLIAACRGEKQCILIAGDMPRSEMESNIAENVEIPKNIRLICRCVDTGDIVSLGVCSIPDCKTVVVNHSDDVSNLKSALAVRRILSENNNHSVKIISSVSSDSFVVPGQLAKDMNLINIPVNDMIARVIAHSCTETGISAVYTDLFDIDGGNLQIEAFPQTVGKTFGEVLRTMNGAVPLGISSENGERLNPPSMQTVLQTDKLIVWAEEGRSVSFSEDRFRNIPTLKQASVAEEKKTVMIGTSKAMKTIVMELPEQPNVLVAANLSSDAAETLSAFVKERNDIFLEFFDGDVMDDAALTNLLTGAHHVVILSDENDEPARVDTLNILCYLKITEIKKRMDLHFSTTLELHSEKHLQLVDRDADTDFIIAPHIVSMFLSQLTDRPGVIGVFKELLSNRGSEIHLKPASVFGDNGRLSCAEIRAGLLTMHMIFLGYFRDGEAVMNPEIDTDITLDADTKLIVISEK